MGSNDIRAQNAEPVQIFYRGQASVRLCTVPYLFLCLAQVDVELQAVLPGKVRAPKHHFLAYGVYRMECHREYSAIFPFEAFLVCPDAFIFLELGLFLIVMVKHDV